MAKKLTLQKFIDTYSSTTRDENDLVDLVMTRLNPGTPLHNRAVALLVAKEAFYDFLDDCGFEVG